MREKIESTLVDLKQQNADDREHLFDVHIAAIDGSRVALGGRVLGEADRLALRQTLQTRLTGLTVDDSGVTGTAPHRGAADGEHDQSYQPLSRAFLAG